MINKKTKPCRIFPPVNSSKMYPPNSVSSTECPIPIKALIVPSFLHLAARVSPIDILHYPPTDQRSFGSLPDSALCRFARLLLQPVRRTARMWPWSRSRLVRTVAWSTESVFLTHLPGGMKVGVTGRVRMHPCLVETPATIRW